jgi:hypothetical protein
MRISNTLSKVTTRPTVQWASVCRGGFSVGIAMATTADSRTPRAAWLNARGIFCKAVGISPISCLVGALDVRGGIGTISPRRIRSADGTINGRGNFNIYCHQIDITVAREARTTSLFALDVPVHVSARSHPRLSVRLLSRAPVVLSSRPATT